MSIRPSASSPSASGRRWTDPLSALTAEVDLVAPCALGGVLNDDTIPQLRCKAIGGAANNQLADDQLDAALAERGILWAPDFVVNAGGIINISVELEPEPYDADRADADVRAIGDTAAADLRRGGARPALTPLRAALALGEQRLSRRSTSASRLDAA